MDKDGCVSLPCTRTQRHKDTVTETQRHRDTETKRHRGAERQRDTEPETKLVARTSLLRWQHEAIGTAP
jgi:hypothetical protein